MSITDELREWGDSRAMESTQNTIRDIADRIDEAIASEYVRLPKDADGEPIHIGDVMNNTHKRGFAAKTVIGISYHEGGNMYVRVDEDELRWYDPLKLRHHHEPTVEDVLREFAKCWDDPAHYAKGELVEAYAEKLREVIEHERD